MPSGGPNFGGRLFYKIMSLGVIAKSTRIFFITRSLNCKHTYGDRGDPPQNYSKIPPFSGSRNGPYKAIRFGATPHNDRDNLSPAFALEARQTFQTKLYPTKPAETFENLPQLENCTKPAKLSGNHAETHANPHKMCGNPAETLRKPCGNPRKLAGNLRKPFGNPAETQGNPYIYPLEIKNI